MTPREIPILLYARALARNDLRPQAAVRAIEAALPSEKMRYAIHGNGSLLPIETSDAALATVLDAIQQQFKVSEQVVRQSQAL